MKNLVLIAAIGKNRELGVNNSLIWHIKEDMKFFKDTTINHPIVMGRKTFDSLPKLLPNRTHIILSRTNAKISQNVITLNSVQEFINLSKNIGDDFYVIGGGAIYQEFMPYATKMLLTEIDESYPNADTFFPDFDINDWNQKVIGEYQDKDIKYLRKLYTKK